MPFLPGGNLVNSDGDRIVDASANAIAEGAIQVLVVAGGFLISASTGGAISPEAGAAMVELYVQFLKGAFPGPPEAENVLDLLDAIKAGTDRLTPDTGTVAQKLDLIDEHVLLIPTEAPEPGGLTTAEHDQLMALLNIDYDQIGPAVWNYDITVPTLNSGNVSYPANTVLTNLWSWATWRAGYKGIPLAGNPHWSLVAADPEALRTLYGTWSSAVDDASVPILDLSTVQAGDDVMTWLQREYPTFTYYQNFPEDSTSGAGVWIIPNSPTPVYGYRCNLTDVSIHTPVVSVVVDPVELTVPVPPVWPGVAGVTLGTTVALTSQLHLVDDMDGVIVAITTPPTRTGLYEVGGAPLDYGQGRIAFETDEGDIEPWQYLGFRTAIYTPKSMAHASGVRFQCLAGAAGTVTPWTVTT